jgi:hypothetical protein
MIQNQTDKLDKHRMVYRIGKRVEEEEIAKKSFC